MHQLNNLDVIILIIVGISALIALSRGLIKEVLSIIGWVLGTASIIYLLPVLSPIAELYIQTGWMVGVVTSLFILITFLIIWILLTGRIVSKIRSSKLSNIDRILGLFFGIARAFLLVTLFYILLNWMVPRDRQSPVFTESKYFNIAGSFAQPIEALIPKETLDTIRKKTQEAAGEEKADKDSEKSKNTSEKAKKDDVDALFEKFARPQVEKLREDRKKLEKIKEDFDGYNNSERDNLDRLIENTLE